MRNHDAEHYLDPADVAVTLNVYDMEMPSRRTSIESLTLSPL